MNPIDDFQLTPAGLAFANLSKRYGFAEPGSRYQVQWSVYDNATDQAEALGPPRELTEAVISLSEARGVTRNDGRFLLAEIRTLHDDYPRWNRRVSVYLHPAEGAFEVVGIDRETDPPSLGMGVGGRN